MTSAWFNGAFLGEHKSGYNSFWLRLDALANRTDAPKATWGGANVLALHVDATSGTGWWYEGGGLFRHQRLVRAPPVHVVPDRTWTHVNVSRTRSAAGGGGGGATFYAATTIANDRADVVDVDASVTLYDADGTAVATAASKVTPAAPNGAETRLAATLSVAAADLHLWSVQDPYLYTAAFSINVGGTAVDAVNVTAGARALRYDADEGLFLNGEHVKVRGFCDHSNFAGVGSAVPDRVNLFRVQAPVKRFRGAFSHIRVGAQTRTGTLGSSGRIPAPLYYWIRE